MTRKPKRGGTQKGPSPAHAPAGAPPASTEAEPEAQAHPGAGPQTHPEMSAVPIPIVGIGASAGGLAAFEAFFTAMPAETEPGMAFVLVQHLAPDHKSILSDLVKRYTRMKVFEAEDGMAVRPNCAYIIPPNRDMAFVNGTLQLLDPVATRGLRLPIDFFFRSLAQDQHERAIGIVLSGTGGDGTLGARAIKGEGGLVMAQTPESTEYDGMPRSVIATGLVDYVLPPAEMPAHLIAFATRAFGDLQPASAPTKSEDQVKKIFVLLRAQTGHDFSHYKLTTISRRIERRMAIHRVEELADYVRYLQEAPAEVDALFGDFLIGVTSFFRDPEAFAAFEEHAVPRLFVDKPASAVIRVWAAGCSTGEEAYSIAILIQERLQALKQSFQVQFFATDIDHRAVDVARAGVYPASIAADVSAERLARFFVQDPSDGAYRINKNIRDMLVFSEHDVIKDPPFSKLDLISCRNLLIYMGGDLQKKLIPLFHYALNPGGILFLGTSESVGESADLFAVTDRKAKLYERQEDRSGVHRPATEGFLMPTMNGRAAARRLRKARGDTATLWREVTERALLQQDTQTGALVNERGDILYLHGRTGHYLEPVSGEAGMNINRMAREGLRRALTTALRTAVTQGVPVRHTGLRVKTNGDFMLVNLIVRPAGVNGDSAAEPRLFVVIVEEVLPSGQERSEKVAVPARHAGTRRATAANARIAALTQELREKEENLHSTNEELETSNEELMSSNEEMQSVNEELQSLNEELETSKEELQSVNEELATVNAELHTKVADLSRTNNDMNNLLAGTGVGTVFVDHQLCIRRFTPAIIHVIALIPTDVGRPVGQLVVNLVGYDCLVADTQEVLDTLVPKQVEVQTAAGAWFLLRIRPYRTLDNVIEGAVISFTEITEMILASAGLRRLAVVVRDAYDAVLAWDLHGRVTEWNPGATRMYGWSEAEALTMNIRDLVAEGRLAEEVAYVQRLSRGEVLEPYRSRRIAKDGQGIDVWVTASVLINDTRDPYAITTTEKRVDEVRRD
jgi:two-component system CheB/CheR fusion protein